MQLQRADASPSPGERPNSGAQSFDAIAFGYLGGAAQDAELRRGSRLRLAYRLEINEYRGTARVQLNCQHLMRLR